MNQGAFRDPLRIMKPTKPTGLRIFHARMRETAQRELDKFGPLIIARGPLGRLSTARALQLLDWAGRRRAAGGAAGMRAKPSLARRFGKELFEICEPLTPRLLRPGKPLVSFEHLGTGRR